MTNQPYSYTMSDIEMDDFIADLGELCDDVVMPARMQFDENNVAIPESRAVKEKSTLDLYWEGSASQMIYDDWKAGKFVKVYV